MLDMSTQYSKGTSMSAWLKWTLLTAAVLAVSLPARAQDALTEQQKAQSFGK